MKRLRRDLKSCMDVGSCYMGRYMRKNGPAVNVWFVFNTLCGCTPPPCTPYPNFTPTPLHTHSAPGTLILHQVNKHSPPQEPLRLLFSLPGMLFWQSCPQFFPHISVRCHCNQWDFLLITLFKIAAMFLTASLFSQTLISIWHTLYFVFLYYLL